VTQDELRALAAVVNALQALQQGDLQAAEECRKTAERSIMKALGMIEIDGNWRMPEPVDTPESIAPATS
jgi:hypothetical protein